MPTPTFDDYVGQQRAHPPRKIMGDVERHWVNRVLPRQILPLGERGGVAYLDVNGKSMGEEKAVHFAHKAEREGHPQFALAFWKKAFRVAYGIEADPNSHVIRAAYGSDPAPAVAARPAAPAGVPPLPEFPGPLQPQRLITMQPVDAQSSVMELVRAPHMWAQRKRNGERCEVLAGESANYYQTRGQTLKGAMAVEFDDAVTAVKARIGPFVIEGEEWYRDVDGGEHMTAAAAVTYNGVLGQPAVPAWPVFSVFKALFIKEKDLTVVPEHERLAKGAYVAGLLAKQWPGHVEFLEPAKTPRQKLALMRQQIVDRREGVVWVDANCFYQGGKNEIGQVIVRSKNIATYPAIVTGLSVSKKADRPFGAMAVAFHNGQGLEPIGEIGTGFTAQDLRDIADRFAKAPPGTMTALIASQWFTESGQAWQGRYVGPASVPPIECVRARAVKAFDDLLLALPETVSDEGEDEAPRAVEATPSLPIPVGMPVHQKAGADESGIQMRLF